MVSGQETVLSTTSAFKHHDKQQQQQRQQRAKCETQTIVRRFIVVLVFEDLVVVAEQVDGDGVLAGVVLLGARQKGLGEVEARHPEDGRRAHVVPVLQELESRHEVVDVAAERLERRVRLLHPHAGNLALQDTQRHLLQVGGHHDQTLGERGTKRFVNNAFNTFCLWLYGTGPLRYQERKETVC